jgi:hypothetical protein
MNKTIEITIEQRRVTLVRRRCTAPLFWCSRCPLHIPMLSPAAAATLAGVTVRSINRSVEADRIHFVETNGQLFVCVSSLLTYLKEAGND